MHRNGPTLRQTPRLFAGFSRQRQQISVERAVHEVRSGRPILLSGQTGDGGMAIAVIAAAELAYPALLHDLAALAESVGGDSRVQLAVTPQRAQQIGLLDSADAAAHPILLPAPLEAQTLRSLAGDRMATTRAPIHCGDRFATAAQALLRAALLLPAAVMVGPVAATALPPGLLADLTGYTMGEAGLVQLDIEAALAFQDGGAAADTLAIVSRARVPLQVAAQAEFVVFRGGDGLRDQVAIIVGSPDPAAAVPVRLHSACLTGDLFGSLRCDCGDQLRGTVADMAANGGGVLLYLDQEGRGTGIASKMRAYALQDTGLDTVEADAALGYGLDERRYDIAARMLALLGFHRIAMLTNNPDKIAAMTKAGIEIVGRKAVLGAVTEQNLRYLTAKAVKAGHLLEDLNLVGSR